jgi:transcriptional regulator with XRE-family HTH domain
MVDQKSFYEEVGKRISKIRLQRQLTQEALAVSVKLTRTSITNVERGRQKLPLYTLALIAESLRVECSELLPKTKEADPINIELSIADRSPSERAFIESAIQAVNSRSYKSI